ncbi:precorrin-3B synthase [Streptomyces sp. NPDC126933]|uniref:precorrin-3B synthase n=1 Tax=unclassified Streptomyces TaxID=2593676 RepID=UPI003666E491
MPPTSPTPVNRDEAPVRERGDACPGALRLHAADDGRLARLRLPAGLLTHRQAEALATAAERLGDGRLDITSRGNVQLRGLGESCGGELAELLYEAGLLPSERHERVRNVIASPLSGLDGIPRADVRLWARELDALLCASEAATALSGRFLFALDDGRGDVAALGADVTLLAQSDGTAVLHTGANGSGLRVSAGDAPRAALLAAETFLTVAAASGSGAWRVRELPAGHGLDAAVTTGLATAGIATEPVAEYGAEYATEPGAAYGAEPGAEYRAEYGADVARPEAGPPVPGPVHSPDGTVALSVYAPLGRLSVAQWRLLLSAGERGTNDRTLRVTPWRGVIVPGLDPATAHDLLDRLRTAGLITDPHSPWHNVGACTGRPGCAKALTDVRADAAEAVTAARPGDLPATGPGGPPATGPGDLPATNPGDLPVYWSGCARRCGHPQGSWVDVVATGEGGYDISVRGHLLRATTGPELAEAVATARKPTTARTTPVTR